MFRKKENRAKNNTEEYTWRKEEGASKGENGTLGEDRADSVSAWGEEGLADVQRSGLVTREKAALQTGIAFWVFKEILDRKESVPNNL